MSVTESATGEVVQIASHDHAAHLAGKIDDLVVRVNRISGELVEVIAEALRLRAWVALGYGSWERMVEQRGWEFAPRTSTDRAALATILRESGMSYRAIGKLVGASPQTVMRDTADATVPDGTVHGLDGKQRPVEFMGEAGTGDGPAASSGGPSPTSDPGEAALGDDAEREPSTVHSSPASPTSGDATAPHTVSDSDQADGAGERAPSASLYEEPAATEDDPVTDTVNQLGRFVAILAGMDEPTAQTVYEQGIWEFALGFIADHPDELDLSDVAVAALRTRSIEVPRGMQ